MWTSLIQYGIKHAMAAGVIVGSTVLLTVIAYFGLIFWALLTDAPLGGPFALPFWALVALVGSIAAVLGMLSALIWNHSVTRSLTHGAIAGLLLLIPLGAYWCSLQAADWIFGICGQAWRWIWTRRDHGPNWERTHLACPKGK